MSANTLQQQAGLLHGRQMVLLVTIALHALVIAVLMTIRVMPPHVIENSLIAEFLTPDKPVEQLPPELVPTALKPPLITVPSIQPPEIVFQSDETITLPPSPPDAGTAGNVVEGPADTGVTQVPSTALQFRAVRPADDYYPSQSLTLQEEGVATVRLCVTPSGKLDGRPVIEKSSGSPRLDAAALTWAREALRFTPATRDGVAIGACKGFLVNFKLH